MWSGLEGSYSIMRVTLDSEFKTSENVKGALIQSQKDVFGSLS